MIKYLILFKCVMVLEEYSLGKGHVITGSTYQDIGLVLLKKGDAKGSLIYMCEALLIF